jgi:hypothetical protein
MGHASSGGLQIHVSDSLALVSVRLSGSGRAKSLCLEVRRLSGRREAISKRTWCSIFLTGPPPASMISISVIIWAESRRSRLVCARWHKALVLIVLAGYLSVVTFGHGFHRHGAGRPVACGCAAACHSGCDGHDHEAEASERHSKHSSDGRADGTGRSASPASSPAIADHGCPICGFFSHHCLPTDAADVVTTDRVVHRVAAVPSLIATGKHAGPQQPRAPPLAA